MFNNNKNSQIKNTESTKIATIWPYFLVKEGDQKKSIIVENHVKNQCVNIAIKLFKIYTKKINNRREMYSTQWYGIGKNETINHICTTLSEFNFINF